MQREARFRRHVLQYLNREPDVFAWPGVGRPGIPDVVGCVRGLFFGFELKTPTGRTSKIQRLVHRLLQRAGGRVVVARSVDEVRRVIESLRRRAARLEERQVDPSAP